MVRDPKVLHEIGTGKLYWASKPINSMKIILLPLFVVYSIALLANPVLAVEGSDNPATVEAGAPKNDVAMAEKLAELIRTGDAKGFRRLAGQNRDAIHYRDASGKSALHHAAAQGDAKLVAALLKAGANPKRRDKDGNRPVDYTEDESIRKLLTQSKAPETGIPPTYKDVQHGSDVNDVMNVWLVDSDEPTPVIVQIHGGGFKGGKRMELLPEDLMKRCQEARISYISIDYKLIDPKHTDIREYIKDIHETLTHIARAIQFIRFKSDEWNIDPDLLGCTGGSAGAAASMWLAYHDDMADPDNADPVLRESTRIVCAFCTAVAVVSLDPLNPEKRKLIETTPVKKTTDARLKAFGLASEDEARPLLETPEMQAVRKELGIIEYITPDDPPVALVNTQSYESYNGNIHNPYTIPVVKRYCDANGLECIPIMFNTPKDEVVEQYDFMIGKLSEARANKK